MAARPAKPKKPVKFTAAQNKSFKAFVQAHPFTQAGFQKYVRSHPLPPAKPAKPRKAAAPALGGAWPLAGNDVRETCALAAITSSLYLATGIWLDEELAEIGDGLSVPDAAEAFRTSVVSDAVLRYAVEVPGSLAVREMGLVVGMTLPDGRSHAALTLGNGLMASWGGVVPMEGDIEEAWYVAWETGS